MEKTVEYLDPGKKLVDEVVGWLCGDEGRASRVRRTAEGAYSLSHVLVVVPTAQSARNLRLALARKATGRKWGGILPPKIAMANALLAPRNVRVATEAEELAAMASTLAECDLENCKALFPKLPAERGADWALDMAGVLLGIQSVLGEAALMMADVKPQNDPDRWLDLAGIERLFVRNLKAKGAVPRCVARKDAVLAGCREDGIEEIVLPSAVDINGAFIGYLGNSPVKVSVLVHAREDEVDKFDEWGRPRAVFAADIAPAMIESLPTAVVEADVIARYFRGVKSDEALPALAVCDAEMYPELEGAFQNHFSEEDLVLRNPSREQLSKSSLGRLLGAIVQLGAQRDYGTFSVLARTGDVARWAQGALSASAAEVAEFTGALDSVQNSRLPQTLADVMAGAQALAESAWSEDERVAAAGLKRLVQAVEAEIGDPFGFLGKIFSSVTLDEKNPADRELIAAAESVRALRDECDSPLVEERFRGKLFSRLLKSATYMLEPTAGNVLATTGWLEVQWCSEDEIVFAGFNEGCVPENVVGHPFIPDSLRRELKIMTNRDREARDSFIFSRAVSCREKGAVSVYLHQISGDRNVMKPSRILFNGIRDEDLPSLAHRLYAVTKGNEGAPVKELPPAWRLKLPFPPRGTVFRQRISPTALDQYLRCPFNFYLQEVFGEHSDDRNQELDAMAFGNLCHCALDRFGKEGPRDSVDAEEIAGFLADEVYRQLRDFGTNLPAIVELQGEAAIERLKAFSVLQAERRRNGWRLVASEQNLACRIKGCPTLLRGKVDRIDRHESTGELAIIDYKTWNRARKENYDSVQLPLYRAMVEASNLYDPEKARVSRAFYCILAERPEDVAFDEAHAFHEGNQSEAEDRIVALLTDISRGIFYPPKRNPGGSGWVWEANYSSLVWETPEKGIDPEWLADQASRREAVQ